MKAILMIITCSTVLCCCISNARQQNAKESRIAAEGIDSVDYAADLLPILQKKCSPCHFTGGKMYERMPFDNPATILSHQTGILKRMKDQPEATLIKQFVQQQAKGN